MYLLSGTGETLAPASLFVHISFLREDEIVSINSISDVRIHNRDLIHFRPLAGLCRKVQVREKIHTGRIYEKEDLLF